MMEYFDLPANFDLRFKTLIISFQNVTYALNNAIKSEYLLSGPSAPQLTTPSEFTNPLDTRRDRKRKRDNPEQSSRKFQSSRPKKKTMTVMVTARHTVRQYNPDRVQTLDSVGGLVLSPYFHNLLPTSASGTEQRTARSSVKILNQQAVQLPTIEPPNEWWAMEPSPVTNTKSITVFRENSALYYNLWLAKPILIQEQISDDPWKLFIATMLLNKTSGKAAIPIFWKILKIWPTPLLMSQAIESELIEEIRSLGLQKTRARRLIALSKSYLSDPPDPAHSRKTKIIVIGERYKCTPVSHLPGAGIYALDSYRIFFSGKGYDPNEWKSVMPSDKELIRYIRWKWAFEERKKWGPDSGVTGDVDLAYLERLPVLLQP